MLRSYSFATHITAELLQIGQAHACHRFVVEDVETEQARLLVSRSSSFYSYGQLIVSDLALGIQS